MIRAYLVILAGLSFGFGLSISGMTNPSRVIGFLDISGDWDPTLVFVMAGAVVSYSAFMVTCRRLKGGRGWFGTHLPTAGKSEISPRLIIGAFVFGVGWALGGFCPGPALARLSAFQVEAFLFVPLMAVGMVLAQRLFGADAEPARFAKNRGSEA